MKNTAVSKKSPVGQQDDQGEKAKTLKVMLPEGMSEERAITEAALTSMTSAAMNSVNVSKINLYTNNSLSLTDAVDVVTEKVQKIQGGNMAGVEAMLASQACTLDALFNNLTHRSILNMAGGYPGAAEQYLRMALKAQSQCRTTLETLNEIKFPKAPTFIRQQNVANQQQVNNGAPVPSHEKDITPTNELLEGAAHGQRMDAGAPRAAIANDPKLETMGLLDGAKVRRRQGAKQQ